MITSPSEHCPNCGRRSHSDTATFCTRCGAILPKSYSKESAFLPARDHASSFGGVIRLVVGVGVYLWVSRHSPHANPWEMAATVAWDPDAYYIKEPVYSAVLLAAALLGLWGAVLIAKGLIHETRR